MMKEKLQDKELIKKILKPLLIIIALTVIVEVFIFNFRHFLTLGNKPFIVDNWVPSTNTSVADYNAFKVENPEEPTYIELTGIDMPINLIYFDMVDVEKGQTAVFDQKYHIEFTDEGNALPYSLPQKSFFRLETKTHYTTVNPYGNVHSVRLYFDGTYEGEVIRITTLVLNPKYELLVSKKRMIWMFLILLMLYLLRPSSSLYEIKVTEKFRGKLTIIAVFLLFEIFFFYKATHINNWYKSVPEGGNTQFMQLTEAIVDRHEVFLAAKAPEGMEKMPDPYDATLRRALFGEDSDVGDMSDTGFYQGRYFVYFGIAPILTFYVPVYAITGTHITTRTVVFILCILNALGVLFLLYEISKKYFKDIPFILYLMASALFTFGAGQLFMATTPDFYTVPIYYALACVLFGLGFWFKSFSDNEEKLSVLYLALGSLFMALPAASRPQFLIGSFLAIIIFWDAVFKEKKLLSLKSLPQSIAFVVPYIIVAAGVMYYNYIRFHNVFDFGANYNLCYNNMPYRGFHIDRLFHATIGYLFYPCTVTNVFPFFELSSYTSTYTGITADETLFGGIIYNNLYLSIVFIAFLIKKVIDKKDAVLLAVICPIFAMIVAIVDANMAGVLPRYYTDFTWLFMISAFILFGYLYMSGGIGMLKGDSELAGDAKAYMINRGKNIIRWVFLILFIVTVFRLFLMIYQGDRIYLNNMNAFFRMKSLIEFWK